MSDHAAIAMSFHLNHFPSNRGALAYEARPNP